MREKLYGITIDQFEARLAAQGGVCAICRGLPAPGRQFHVDHDHTTGAIRGILCQKCNGGLGAFGDTAAGLRVALAYLELDIVNF